MYLAAGTESVLNQEEGTSPFKEFLVVTQNSDRNVRQEKVSSVLQTLISPETLTEFELLTAAVSKGEF